MNDGPKWATFALLKLLDSVHGGELHDEFAAIAGLLNLELPATAPPPDQAPDGEAEADGEAQASERICQFLENQTAPVSLAKIIAELDLRRWTAVGTLGRLQRQGRIEHPGHDAWQIRKPAPGESGDTQ
jgi:hypothetical protein